MAAGLGSASQGRSPHAPPRLHEPRPQESPTHERPAAGSRREEEGLACVDGQGGEAVLLRTWVRETEDRKGDLELILSLSANEDQAVVHSSPAQQKSDSNHHSENILRLPPASDAQDYNPQKASGLSYLTCAVAWL